MQTLETKPLKSALTGKGEVTTFALEGGHCCPISRKNRISFQAGVAFAVAKENDLYQLCYEESLDTFMNSYVRELESSHEFKMKDSITGKPILWVVPLCQTITWEFDELTIGQNQYCCPFLREEGDQYVFKSSMSELELLTCVGLNKLLGEVPKDAKNPPICSTTINDENLLTSLLRSPLRDEVITWLRSCPDLSDLVPEEDSSQQEAVSRLVDAIPAWLTTEGVEYSLLAGLVAVGMGLWARTNGRDDGPVDFKDIDTTYTHS